MKKAIAMMVLATMWGCSSEPTVDDSSKPPVVDAKPTPSKPTPPGTGIQATPPVAQKPLPPTVGPRGQTNLLKDPSSILSKRSVFYDYDSDAIRDEFRPLIQAHARYLVDNPGAKMLIQGNCDERGSREYNIALGQRRADALRRTLGLLGARENQIETTSLGEEKPRCTDQTEACYQQNRRSDMLYGGEF
jgi:peptidoglycan-associated lipoprotein